jgi:uncharacterized membrane protein
VAVYHPQIVHFAIALLVVGVVFRLISLYGRPAWVSPAATTLLVLGTIATFLAVKSGDDAHGPVERIPGARPAVVEHEEWGERTRNIFIIVIAIEALTVAFRRSPRLRMVHGASAAVGLVGLVFLYQAAAHGGQLVYGYAGGVGIRSGDPADVERLLLAGLYQQAQVDRRAGRPLEAAVLIEQAARRQPNDPEVKLAAAESRLVDRQDPEAALAILQEISPPRENASLRVRHGLMTADALVAAGQRDGALAVLQGLATEYPDNARVRGRLEELQGAAR